MNIKNPIKLTEKQQNQVRLAISKELYTWKKYRTEPAYKERWPYAENQIDELEAILKLFYEGDIFTGMADE